MLFSFFSLLGPLLGFPVQDIDVTVQSLTMHPDTSHTMVSACVSRCLQKVQQNLKLLLNTVASGITGKIHVYQYLVIVLGQCDNPGLGISQLLEAENQSEWQYQLTLCNNSISLHYVSISYVNFLKKKNQHNSPCLLCRL